MRVVLACALLLGSITAITATSACGGREAKPQHVPKLPIYREKSPGPRRELTWNEYYAGVRERAFKRNALVIWINPPKVRKPKPMPREANPTEDSQRALRRA